MKKFHLALVLLLGVAFTLIQSLGLIKGLSASAEARLKHKAQASQTVPARARLSEQISVRAAGLGRPLINLGDGHDLMTAYSGMSEKLQFVEFNLAQAVSRAQPLALASGDFDEDGVPDLISAFAGSAGVPPAISPVQAQLLVFEGPEGALKRDPETIALPAPATSLALGQLDDSYEMDLAVAAGNDLVIVHGRDRKLSIDEEERAKVRPPEVEKHEMPFAIGSIAIGNFTRNDRDQIAALSDDGVIHVIERSAKQAWGKVTADIVTPLHTAGATVQAAKTATIVKARVSISGFDDVVVVDSVNRQLHIVSNGVQSTDSSRAVAPVSEPRAVATGSSVTNPQSAIRNPRSTDPVASTTPSGLPAWGPQSARGTDTQDPTKVETL